MNQDIINENNNFIYNLKIPILNGYELVKEPNKALFIAKSQDNSTEQYIEEGRLLEQESYKERLNNIIKITEELFEKNNYEKKPLLFIKDYETSILSFKIYLQDNIREGQCIRQLNAYFVDPKTKYIYQLILSAPPLNIKDINDNVLKNIYKRLIVILDNIKFNEDNIKES